MMKLQGFDTTIISADLTPASLIGDRLQTQFFASLLDGQDQILTSVSVSTPFCHHGTPYYSRLLCRLSYRGSSTVYETDAGWFCSRGLTRRQVEDTSKQVSGKSRASLEQVSDKSRTSLLTCPGPVLDWLWTCLGRALHLPSPFNRPSQGD